MRIRHLIDIESAPRTHEALILKDVEFVIHAPLFTLLAIVGVLVVVGQSDFMRTLRNILIPLDRKEDLHIGMLHLLNRRHVQADVDPLGNLLMWLLYDSACWLDNSLGSCLPSTEGRAGELRCGGVIRVGSHHAA